ncbi:MAG: hypothetical protein HRT35_26255 [Algicola sp.]|nr:hypothetical protein [Algicola sp.]
MTASVYGNALGSVVRLDRLGIEQGLSQSTVFDIIRDQQGFMWFATSDGLNRYDGYQFKIYRHNPSKVNSIGSNYIVCLLLDSKGSLWVGTDGGGLNRYNVQSDSFERFEYHQSDPHSLSHNSIRTLYEDGAGELWIGTDGGLNRYDHKTGRFERFEHQTDEPDSLSQGSVMAILADSNGGLWVGTDGGGLNLFSHHTRRFTHIRHQPAQMASLSSDRITGIVEDADGLLWIGTDGGGLNRFDQKQTSFTHFKHRSDDKHSLSNDGIKTLLIDAVGRFWIGTYTGLNRFDTNTGRFKLVTDQTVADDGLGTEVIFSLFTDSLGVTWVGTLDSGVIKYDSRRELFSHFKHQTNVPGSLSLDNVRALLEDMQGNLWVGTRGGGLNKYDPNTGQFSHYRHQPSNPSSLAHDLVMSISQDSPGKLWIGTFGGGVDLFDIDSEQFEHFTHQQNNTNSLSHNNVYVVHKDRRGMVWIATLGGGLNRYDPKTGQFSRYRHDRNDPGSIGHDNVMTLFEDQDGQLWAGTWGGGLNRFDRETQRFIHFKHDQADPSSLSTNRVTAIYQTRGGQLWMGTYGGGLNKFDKHNHRFKHYREKHGLANDSIYGIAEDQQGLLWISTNQGISVFDPVAETFKNYDVFDGLQSNEFNLNAHFKSTKGELFFGGINGFNRFMPADLKEEVTEPALVFSEFLLFNKQVPVFSPDGAFNTDQSSEQIETGEFTLDKAIGVLDKITLTHQQSVVAFEFAALDYTNGQKTHYAYRLDGHSEQWIETDADNRRATYTNLPPGNFTLRVKAGNGDGSWHVRGASIDIEVLPPPWKTRWAYGLYLLVLLGLMYVMVSVRTAHIRAQEQVALNRLLDQRVSERTVELENKNREILATREKLILNEKLASLGTLMAGVAHEIKNPANFVKLSVYNLETDLKSCRQYIYDLAGEEAEQSVLDGFDAHFDPLTRHIELIKEGSGRIQALALDLKTSSHKSERQQSEVCITDILMSSVNLLLAKYKDRIEITTEFVAKPKINCYPDKLNQVFLNLLVNACDAFDDKSKTHDSKIVVRCDVVENKVHITLTDNGCGMTKATMDKIFEPFYTTKNISKGTGLGLSISFDIVHQHGGELIAESELGVGSVFRVVLPLANP